MFNKEQEIDHLTKSIKAVLSINLDELDFNLEASLIRHFEVIGGIAKELKRAGSDTIKNNFMWNSAIRMRDKISHSYYSLSMKPIIAAIKDLGELLLTISSIKKEFNIKE